MSVGVAGVKSLADGLAHHDLGSGAEGDLLLVEDEGVGEDFGHAFELMMRGDDEVSTFGEVDEAVGKVAAAFDVETVKGFIEKKDVGLLGEGAGDVSSLLLAAGELVDLAVGDVAEVHDGDGFFGLFAVNLSEAFKVAEVWEAAHRDDVADSDREVALVLIHLGEVGDFASRFGDRVFTPVDDAGLLFEQSGEEPNEGAFSGTVWAEEGETLAAVDGEVNFTEGGLGSVTEPDAGEVELMMLVSVAHGCFSQVKVTSSVTSPKPQRVWSRSSSPSGRRVRMAADSGVFSGQVTETRRVTFWSRGKWISLSSSSGA